MCERKFGEGPSSYHACLAALTRLSALTLILQLRSVNCGESGTLAECITGMRELETVDIMAGTSGDLPTAGLRRLGRGPGEDSRKAKRSVHLQLVQLAAGEALMRGPTMQ